MLFITLATILTASSSVAAAPADLERRACQVKEPSQLFSISQGSPDQNTGGPGSYVYTAQDTGKTDQISTLLQFSGIPANAYGCSVEYVFGPGARVDNFGDTKLDFYVADRAISNSDTWNNKPGKRFLAGTQLVKPFPGQSTKYTVVTGACAETLNYIIDVQGDRYGLVGFLQAPGNGLRLTYNC